MAEEVVSAILERISERVEGEAEEGMRTRLCQAMQGQGVFVNAFRPLVFGTFL